MSSYMVAMLERRLERQASDKKPFKTDVAELKLAYITKTLWLSLSGIH